MERVEYTIQVDSPPAAIVNYLRRPQNLLDIWPDTIAIDHVESLPHGTTRFEWKKFLFGVHFEGAGESVASLDNCCVAMSIFGGVMETMTWDIRAFGERCDVKLSLSYKLPLPLRQKHSDEAILRQFDNDARGLLKNLRVGLEAAKSHVDHDLNRIHLR